ncbi:MAG TPA: ATPase domain-containing protein, partial [Verrucomicrobiae bacterium]|nr:ATPase domain-containing protein [Verrucomicrobiae bacterium]
MKAKKNDAVVHLAKKRCVSGVEGLDEILAGGLPEKCFYLIQGDPGSGKTTLALQFLLEGKANGESVFYITLSETRNELLTVAQSHGWSLDGIPLMEMSSVEKLLRPEEQTSVFHSSEIELNTVSQMLLEKIREAKPTRLVFDSLSEFRLLAETPLRYRRQLLAFKRAFADLNCTVLLLDDRASGTEGDPHILSLSHGVVQMEQLSPDYGASRRRMRVLKMRGVRFYEGYHDYIIATGGVRIFPRLVAAQHRGAFPHESVSSGIAEIDKLFGGGLDRGTTTLILGPAGTGKSSLALQHVEQALKRGERAMVFTFDETLGIMLARTKGLGMHLEPHIKSGLLTVQQIDPAELSPGEFAVRVQHGVEDGARMVMIDSLNGYLNAMPGEKYLNNQLHELCSYLNQQGVVTILVLAQYGLVSAAESPVDLSYLADTVAHLRFFEVEGMVRQALAVIKKRSGPHEKT